MLFRIADSELCLAIQVPVVICRQLSDHGVEAVADLPDANQGRKTPHYVSNGPSGGQIMLIAIMADVQITH